MLKIFQAERRQHALKDANPPGETEINLLLIPNTLHVPILLHVG